MKYLLCIDGSDHSRQAAALLQRVVRAGDHVTVLNVVQRGVGAAVCAPAPRPNQSLVDRAAEQFKDAAEAEPLALVDDAPRDTILKIAAERHVDAVVLGSRGMSALKRMIIGSVSTYVLHAVTNRIVVVAHQPEIVREPLWMVCIDGSDNSMKAAKAVTRLLPATDKVTLFAAVLEPSMYVVYVDQPINNPNYESTLRERMDVAQQFLNQARAVLLAAGVAEDRIAHHVQLCVDPREAISDYADTNKVSTIVTGARGMSSLQRLVMGSTSTYLVQNAPHHNVVVVPSEWTGESE